MLKEKKTLAASQSQKFFFLSRCFSQDSLATEAQEAQIFLFWDAWRASTSNHFQNGWAQLGAASYERKRKMATKKLGVTARKKKNKPSRPEVYSQPKEKKKEKNAKKS